MSVKRLFHWKCNKCLDEVTKVGYGLPSGWIWKSGKILTNEPLKHYCKTCKGKI